ncbi:hypothetical protein GOP47_0012449 [Adiantum capillus-veneris]|uniref:Bidirectional sugar transporter SWEET n=1 Tax=Adiantum capillus-veneris TaxID=13818 RepID=A0A9D4UQP8_ADICA|nr:hypothetical protein GOP47_0012449 [Adiantum capillus-veneris]
MGQREIAHAALGILGNIASVSFFLSSAPTIIKIVRCKSSGGISGDLYVFKLFNCMLWCLYGLPYVHPHDLWVVITNSFGCTFALIYIGTYLSFATTKEKVSLVWKLGATLASFVTLVVLLVLLSKTRGQRILAVGVLSAIVSSGMHLTLLSQCRMAIQSRDKKFLHPTESLAAFVKGAIWTAYGLVNLDIFILIPNGVGIIIGVIQVALVLLLLRDAKSKCNVEDLHDKIDRQTQTSQEIVLHLEGIGTQDSNETIGKGITPLANISRVSSLLGISRQGSISSSIVVPIMLMDAEKAVA